MESLDMEFDADDLELEPTKSVQKKRPRRNSDISVGTAHLSTPRTSSRQGVQPTPDRTPSTRRSQRGKNIDVSRPMLLVMPDTDIRDKLDIRSDFEFEQFLAAMDEDNSGDWSDGDEGSVGGHHEPSALVPSVNSLKMEVITPSVRATNSGIPMNTQVTSHFDFDLKKDKRGPTSSSSSSGARINHDNYSMIPSLHENPFDQLYQYAPYSQYYDGYFDYDCNEDDMNFLDTMKQRLLSTNTFENYHLQKEFLTSMNEIMNYRLVELMFQRLEKELELMISQYDYNKDCSNYYKNLKTSLHTIEQLFNDKFFHDVLQKKKNSGDDGESAAKTAQLEVNTPSIDRKEDEVDNDEDDSDGNSAEEITERLMTWLKGNEVFDISSNNSNAFYRGRTDSTVSLPELLQSTGSINGLPSNIVLPTHLNTGSTSALPTPSSGKHLDKSSSNENQIKRPKFNQKDLENYFHKDRRYIKLLLPIIHRYIIDKNPFKYYNTNNNGTNSGSNNNGMSSMMMSKTPYKQLIGGEIEIDWNLLDPKYYHTIELFCLEIVNYYIQIRCNDKQSLLRGYHTFIMPLWQRCHEGNTIPYYRDYSKESFLYSYKQLQVIRNDLNRARLIIDRVRRREKMKKELLRCCNDHLLQNVLQLPPINNHPNLTTLMMMNDITLPQGLTSASLDAINNTLASSSSLHRMNRSLSFVSEGGLSVDGGNITTMPRKRGRPRRIFPTSGTSSVSDKKNIHGLDDASLGVMASSHFSTSGNSNNNVPIIVKYVQGRDKNGKFLKKAPIIIGAAAATTTVTTSHIISGSNNSLSSQISCSNSSQQQVNNSTNSSNSSSLSNQANTSTENTNTAPLLPSSACSSSSLSNQPGTSLQDNTTSNSCPEESKDSNNSSGGVDMKSQSEKLEGVVRGELSRDLSVTVPPDGISSVSNISNPSFPKVLTTSQYLNPNRDITVPAISFSISSTDNDNDCENEIIVTAPANDSHGKEEEMSSIQRKKSKKDMKVRIKQEHQYDSEEGTTMSCHSSESISLLSLSSQRDTVSNVY